MYANIRERQFLSFLTLKTNFKFIQGTKKKKEKNFALLIIDI